MLTQTRTPSRSLLSLSLASLLAALAVWWLGACQPPPPDLGPGEIASVNGVIVKAGDLRRRFWDGTVDERYGALKKGGRMYLLNLVIADILMYEETQRRGWVTRFTEIKQYHERLMKRFLAKEFEHTVRPEDISQEELRAEYDKLRPTLEEPYRRNIEVYGAESREDAEAILDDVAKARSEGNAAALLKIFLASEQNEVGAEKGVFSFDESVQRLGDDVAQAAFDVDIDDEGYHPEPVPFREHWGVVVVLGDSEPQPVPPLEKVEHQIRQRVHSRRRDEALDAFVASFRKNHEVEINESYIDLVPWVIELPPEDSTGMAGRATGPSLPLPAPRKSSTPAKRE